MDALEAMAQVFRDTAEYGPSVALENLADWMNGHDAVMPGDEEAYIAAMDRIGPWEAT